MEADKPFANVKLNAAMTGCGKCGKALGQLDAYFYLHPEAAISGFVQCEKCRKLWCKDCSPVGSMGFHKCPQCNRMAETLALVDLVE